MGRIILTLLSCLGLVACVGTIDPGDEMPPGDPPGNPPGDPPGNPPGNPPSNPPPPSKGYAYTADIAPRLAFCSGCHANANPDGNYHTDSYLGLLGNGKDGVPNIIKGDANSMLVLYMAPAPGKNHKNVNTAVPGLGAIVYGWVVMNNAAQ